MPKSFFKNIFRFFIKKKKRRKITPHKFHTLIPKKEIKLLEKWLDLKFNIINNRNVQVTMLNAKAVGATNIKKTISLTEFKNLADYLIRFKKIIEGIKALLKVNLSEFNEQINNLNSNSFIKKNPIEHKKIAYRISFFLKSKKTPEEIKKFKEYLNERTDYFLRFKKSLSNLSGEKVLSYPKLKISRINEQEKRNLLLFYNKIKKEKMIRNLFLSYLEAFENRSLITKNKRIPVENYNQLKNLINKSLKFKKIDLQLN